MTENTENKQSHLFKSGQSGNPSGRPKGALNKSTLACRELLGGEVEGVTRKLIESALEGNLPAIKLVLDRLAPPPRQANIEAVKLPKLRCSADLPIFFDRLNDLLEQGELSLDELNSYLAMADKFSKSYGLVQLEKQLDDIKLELKKR